MAASAGAAGNAAAAAPEEDLWSSMLSNVASSKRLPQKSILVLGGGADEQKEFVDALGGFTSDSRKQNRRPPVANEFALGYTYLDVLDAEQEDVLARLGLYLVSSPTPAFSPLLKPLFTPELLPDTLVVLLLDWRTPWTWLRQTRRWIRLLRNIFSQLDNDAKEALEEVMKAWEARPRNFGETGAVQVPGAAPEVQIPLGPGEFDEPLGLPLLVVCQNQTLRHNVIERERVLVPPSWDSWGKIRVLRDFDVEGVGAGWSVDIDFSPSSASSGDATAITAELDASVEGGAVELYEDVIKDRRGEDQLAALRPKGAIEMPPVDLQEFLTQQLEVLETRKEDEKGGGGTGGVGGGLGAGIGGAGARNAMGTVGIGETDSRVRDHVGPVQFNVGGIQVDADDMLRRIKDRDAAASLDPSGGGVPGASPTSPGGGDGKSQNEVLAQFFSSLMNKKGAGAKGGPGSGGGGVGK
ncbi:hypothetical protein AA313_de0200519 [Arthrobotrys entomopaga]|nr:hypothetical protein AA313_de0200519 [Arthrobotrys entomopaga]